MKFVFNISSNSKPFVLETPPPLYAVAVERPRLVRRQSVMAGAGSEL